MEQASTNQWSSFFSFDFVPAAAEANLVDSPGQIRCVSPISHVRVQRSLRKIIIITVLSMVE